MVVKAYFDCTWTGPLAKVDDAGKVISIDRSDARELPPVHLPSAPSAITAIVGVIITAIIVVIVITIVTVSSMNAMC